MAPSTKTFIKAFRDAKHNTVSDEQLSQFRDINPDFFKDGEVPKNKKLLVPLKNGGNREYKISTGKVISMLIAEYNKSKSPIVEKVITKAAGRRLTAKTEEGETLRSLFQETFGDTDSVQPSEKEEYEVPGDVDVKIPGEETEETEQGDTFESRSSEETKEAPKPAPLPKPAPKPAPKSSPKPAPKSEPKIESEQRLVPRVVDEPKTTGVIANTIDSFSKVDFSEDSVESRIDQIQSVLDTVDTFVSSNIVPKSEVPDNILQSTKQGLDVIRSSVKEGKSKKSIFDKVKNVAKNVLGFVALAPLPIPSEIQVGADTLLKNIEAAEQTKQAIDSITGKFTDETKAGINVIRDIEDLAPAAEFEDGIISATEGAIEVKKALFSEQEGKDASQSTPIASDVAEGNLLEDIQIQKARIDDNIESSGGVIQIQEIDDSKARTVTEPINIGGNVVTPEQAQEYATDKSEGVDIDKVSGEESEGGGPPPQGPAQGESGSEGDQDQGAAEGPTVLQGNTQVQGIYRDPIHPDALGIYFGSSSFPKWDTSLLADRDRRFADLTPEEVKPYLLQQSRMIFEKHSVDLMIPKLEYDESSDPLDVKRENFEIVQLWAKLKGISGKAGSGSDIVGVKLGDLIKFRGLMTGDSGPKSSNLLSSVSAQATSPEDVSQPQEPQEPQAAGVPIDTERNHPKDTTKNFVYTPGAVRINHVVSHEEAIKSARPSLSEITTLEGYPQLQTRRNLTRGFNHGGPSLRSTPMDELRRSAMGTVMEDRQMGGRSLRTSDMNLSARVRL